MRNDLIRAILDCSTDDLNLLDDAGADMYKVIKCIREEEMEITLTSVMREIFREGIWKLGEAVKDLQNELEAQEASGSMTEAGYEQLKALRDHNINPETDFGFYLNFQDTHLFAPADKQEVYEDLFEQELQDLENYTGFCIEW